MENLTGLFGQPMHFLKLQTESSVSSVPPACAKCNSGYSVFFIQIYKQDLVKAEELEIKLPTSFGSQ